LLQDGEHLTLPQHTLLDRTRKVRDELLRHRQRLMSSVPSAQSPGGATAATWTTGAEATRTAALSQQQRSDQEIFVSFYFFVLVRCLSHDYPMI